MKEHSSQTIGAWRVGRGSGANLAAQLLVAALLGVTGGVVALQVTHHPASLAGTSGPRPSVLSRVHAPTRPYATAAALLTHPPHTPARELVHLPNGNLMFVIASHSGQRQGGHERPIRQASH